jgi:ABC-type lipoprotein release transport system permease subunit
VPTYAAVSVLMMTIGLISALVPTARAVRVAPMVALRYD